MVLGDVEETHTSIEVDEETLEESITVRFEFKFPFYCFDETVLTPFPSSLLKELWKSCLFAEMECFSSLLPLEPKSKFVPMYSPVYSSYTPDHANFLLEGLSLVRGIDYVT